MSIYIKDIFQKYIKISQYKKKEKVVGWRAYKTMLV